VIAARWYAGGMRAPRWTCALLLLAAGCGKETEKQLADVKWALAEVRTEFAAYKETATREIMELKGELEYRKRQQAESEQTRVEDSRDLVANIEALRDEIDRKAAEAAAALQRADALAKARDALQHELESVKSTLASQTDKVDSLTAELKTLKKILGR